MSYFLLQQELSLLLAGDEVVEWNGRSLQGATFEEVYDIILESKQESQVELIVHRSVKYVYDVCAYMSLCL